MREHRRQALVYVCALSRQARHELQKGRGDEALALLREARDKQTAIGDCSTSEKIKALLRDIGHPKAKEIADEILEPRPMSERESRVVILSQIATCIECALHELRRGNRVDSIGHQKEVVRLCRSLILRERVYRDSRKWYAYHLIDMQS